MMSRTRTAPIVSDEPQHGDPERPALVAVYSGRALSVVVSPGKVGRDRLRELGLVDDQMSRDHFGLSGARRLVLEDLGSRNGTFVDGQRVTGKRELDEGAVVRAGRTLFVAVRDAGKFADAPTHVRGEQVQGPALADLIRRAQAYGRLGQLLVLGASGTGKELLARAFHESQGAGPFVAINCATIAPAIAERLLFGAKKGAFTGAEQDAIGHVQAADGGTLFLDEVAELEPGVQAKLLRFLETREFFAVGDVRPRRAEVRVCFATMKDLRSDVASKRFREDLFHRIATPMLELPPLAARRYEIPFLIELELRRAGSAVRPSLGFVERALTLRWPGNVRELLRTVEACAVTAEVDGRDQLGAEHLPKEEPLETDGATAAAEEPKDEDIRLALQVSAGNVSVAARALGIHRSKLRRWMEKHGAEES